MVQRVKRLNYPRLQVCSVLQIRFLSGRYPDATGIWTILFEMWHKGDGEKQVSRHMYFAWGRHSLFSLALWVSLDLDSPLVILKPYS